MKPTNVPPQSNSAHLETGNRIIKIYSRDLFLRIAAIVILAGLLVGNLYWSSAASTNKAFINNLPAAASDEITAPVAAAGLSRVASLAAGNYSPLFALPQNPPLATVTTYASNCSTPKTVFNLQDADKVVCAKVTGAQPWWRIIWSNSNFVAVKNVPIGSGTSTFTLTPASSLGDWRVILYDPFGDSVQQRTSFTVVDAQNPVVDVQMDKGQKSNVTTAGAQVVYAIQVTNGGPDSAAGVQLVDDVPANTTFVSFSQLAGPLFSCSNPTSGSTGTTVCTIASLGSGDKAIFLATYLVDSGVSAGSSINNTATVSNTVSDSNTKNNSSSASVPVGSSPCVLTCPTNITVPADSTQAGAVGAVVTFADPSSTGDCGQPFNSNPASGSFFPVGTTTVSSAGQTGGVCTFQVTVENPGGLSISLNGANPFDLECGTDFVDPSATAVNGVGSSVAVEVSGTVDIHTPGAYILTYTATVDPNSVSTTRTVNVSDVEAPLITIEGPNPMTLECHAEFVDPGVSALDSCQGSVAVSTQGTVNRNAAGTYTITYTASDRANNTATATREVTVVNCAALSISLNGNTPVTLECGDAFDDPGATAVNSSGQSVPVSVAYPTGFNPNAPAVGSYVVTYSAKEGTNTVSTTRTVNVVDTKAPEISLEGANPMTLSCGAPFVDPGYSARDHCVGIVPVTVTGSVNKDVPGTYVLIYSATDGTRTRSVKRKVIVGDPENSPPTITLNGDSQMTVECGTTFTDPGATATAACGGTVPVVVSGSVNANMRGTYTITYTATSGNQTAQATRTVVVAPTIILNGANPMTVECHTSFTDPGAVAHDACGSDFAATASGSVDANTVGTYVITYNATDPSGHASTRVTRTVNVVDTTAPVVTAPANVTVNTGAGNTSCTVTVSDATLGSASATDSCQGSVGTSRSGVPAGNIFPVGTTTITYSATDASNNAGTATQTVTVIDNTSPTLTLNGANPQTVECHTSYPELGATANDNCGASFAATPSGSVNVDVPGDYTITYNATDAAGNAAVPVTRTVRVRDTIKPVITRNGPASVTVECHTSYADDGASASDSCDTNVPVTTSGSVDVNAVGTYTLTYSATDDSGNAADAVTRTVTVVDTTAPTITLNSYAPSMWPPNHKYTTFQLTQFVTGASDSCNTSLGLGNVVIEKVTSDEIENGNGDGNTFNDIVIAANCKSVQLRSEREGGGNGRVYTITFKVTDASGNVGRATAKVVVPHNPGQTPVDSGVHYTVNCP